MNPHKKYHALHVFLALILTISVFFPRIRARAARNEIARPNLAWNTFLIGNGDATIRDASVAKPADPEINIQHPADTSIADAEGYDPSGWIYDEATGDIISGGEIFVSPSMGVNIIHNGSNGYYQFTVPAAGDFTLSYTPPSGYRLSDSCLAQSSTLDLGPTDPNPYAVGVGSRDGATNKMTNWDCGDNPYYWNFHLAIGDPIIINNNIPLQQNLPEIDVQRPAGTSIADGNADAQWTKQSGQQVALTYTIANTGSGDLNITDITSANATNVSVDSISSTNFTVIAGNIATFDVAYTPATGDGTFSFELDITNDDPNEGNYDITVSGMRDAAPSVTAIDRADGNPTNATSVDFTVTFSEAISDIETGDFALALIGTANGTINSVSASIGTTVTVTVNGISGDGTLGLNFDFDALDSVVDDAGNIATADFTGESYTIAATPSNLPETGFRHGVITLLPEQPTAKAYTDTAMLLEIPKLNVTMPIVGVPQSEDGWDVTWLGNSAGYLAGSAFPTWAGNTVITGHVWDVYNQPGIFSDLKTLKYGDQVQIQAWGLTYTYEVRESKLVTKKNVNAAFQSEEYDWLTLVTCEFYNPFSRDYLFRRAVRAVLISVQ
ncbi:MAG: sortase [Anaerolineae bacterium]|jgi:LPXTG-site transpeptidase (sortase) family protein|nr:sortase [Anaerolineae bacterium]